MNCTAIPIGLSNAIKPTGSDDVPTPASIWSTTPNIPTPMIPIMKKPMMCGLFCSLTFPPEILDFNNAPMKPNIQMKTPNMITVSAVNNIAIASPLNNAVMIP